MTLKQCIVPSVCTASFPFCVCCFAALLPSNRHGTSPRGPATVSPRPVLSLADPALSILISVLCSPCPQFLPLVFPPVPWSPPSRLLSHKETPPLQLLQQPLSCSDGQTDVARWAARNGSAGWVPHRGAEPGQQVGPLPGAMSSRRKGVLS